MEFDRGKYLNELIARQNNGLIKIITGMRRSGKSYLLFELFYSNLLKQGIHPSHIITISFDDRQYASLRQPDTCYYYVKDKIIDEKNYYILLDEVQLLDEFEDVLNGFLHIKNVDVYVTGSNSKLLSSDVVTTFRGRGDEIKLHTLSFAEFFECYNGTWDNAWKEYSAFGGLPFVCNLQTDERKIDYLSKILRETYIADLKERHNIRFDDELEDLFNVLASGIGSLTNPNRIANTFKSEKHTDFSAPTIKQYIDYMIDAFIIDKAVRYNVKGRKYINTPVKYYFSDIGIRNSRLGFRQQEETHIMENIIFNELKIRGYLVDVGVVEILEKQANKYIRKPTEVDFIANKGTRRVYIQSALSIDDPQKLLQESLSLSSLDNSFEKYIIVKSDIKPWQTEQGINIIGLKDFLLEDII